MPQRPLPQDDRHTVGVVGAGRVGVVLAAALRASGHDIAAITGGSAASRDRVAALLPGVRVDEPSAVARGCDLLLITVPDDVLTGLVSMLCASGGIRPGQLVVHTCGKHGLSVLQPASARRAVVLAMHPAMTFTGTDLDLTRLPGCVFGVTAREGTEVVAERLVADLRGTIAWISEEHRVLYHAGLAHGANHLVTLVGQAMALLREAGIDDPARTLRPLLGVALDNALGRADAALTGPVVRGDVETVRAHLVEVAASAPAVLASYVVLARATAHRAVLDGLLAPERAARLVGVLDDAPAGVADPLPAGTRPGRPA